MIDIADFVCLYFCLHLLCMKFHVLGVMDSHYINLHSVIVSTALPEGVWTPLA